MEPFLKWHLGSGRHIRAQIPPSLRFEETVLAENAAKRGSPESLDGMQAFSLQNSYIGTGGKETIRK